MPDEIAQLAPENPTKGETAPKKKKKKVRSAWISFGGRVIAQIVGAAASVVLGIVVVQHAQRRAEAPAAASTSPPVVPRAAMATRPSGEIALAVLPLDNFSADAKEEYFADGMTEALTAELAQISGLHVISRTSTMRYKQQRKSIPEVAEELDVDFVVEGSVVRANERVRVTAQLINGRTDEHVWARSYDRRLRDVLSLQATVAAAIASELKGVLAAPAAAVRKPVDPAVYDLYLRGRHAWALRTPEGFENAVKYFTEATRRDPAFALGYAGLADTYVLYPTASLGDTSSDNYERARTAAEKALALDEGLAEAHTSLGAVDFFGKHDFAAASREFERAFQLNAHYPTAHQWYAIALSEQGKHQEAARHAREAVDEDPLNGTMHQALGLVLYYARQYDAAVKSERRIAHARAGRREKANEIYQRLARSAPQSDVLPAQWYAATGNYDAAFDALAASQATLPSMLRVDPLFDDLRADRRFAAAMGAEKTR